MIRRYFREREKRTLRLCSAIAAIALITMTVPRQSAGQQIARPALSLELKAALARARERTMSVNEAAGSLKPSGRAINANALNLPTGLISG